MLATCLLPGKPVLSTKESAIGNTPTQTRCVMRPPRSPSRKPIDPEGDCRPTPITPTPDKERDRAVGQIQCRLTVESDLSVLTSLQAWLDEFCDRQQALAHWSEDRRYCLKLALAEGFSNAVRHAHRHRRAETPIDLEIRLDDRHLRIYIWDFGDPFNPNHLEEPKPGTLRQGGYGWFLLRRLCDRVTYRRDRYGRNCLVIEQGLANR